MQVAMLLPAIQGLDVLGVTFREEQFLVAARTTTPIVVCPRCQQATDRVHSFYERRIADLPWAGFPVLIKLRVRKFFCCNAVCLQRVFCERLAPQVAAYARRTSRQLQHLRILAISMGGELTARILPRLGLLASPAMLLQLVRTTQTPALSQVRVLGIDDWAKRKGQTYGTILVDLEQSQVVKLLEDRSLEVVAAPPGSSNILKSRSSTVAVSSIMPRPQHRQRRQPCRLLTVFICLET